MECCSARIVWSTSPRRKVPRTKPMISRSSRDSRCAPVLTRSGRSSADDAWTSSDILKHDVDVAGRGQVGPDRVEHVLGEVLVVHLSGAGAQLERGVRLEIALGVERAQQLVAGQLR